MPRQRRILLDNAIYHIIQRGHNKDELFNDIEDYKAFKNIIQLYKKKFVFHIYHYCLMPNHFHLLLNVKLGADLPKIFHGINQSYCSYFKRKYNHTGFLYQNRYKSFLIENDTYLLECARYIERNPVRGNLVSEAAKYPWTSYNYYANGKFDDLITENPLYTNLGKTDSERRNSYIQYINQPRLYEEVIDDVFAR